MSTLTLPNTLTPGTLEDIGDVQENFTAIGTLVNGGLDGANLAQVVSEQLAVSAPNYPRRAPAIAGATESVALASSTYTRIVRVSTIIVPTGGFLHVSFLATAFLFTGSAAVISFAVQLNGVTARSRFGVTSGASTGLMEKTGVAIPAASGNATWAQLFTDPTVDIGLGAVVSSLDGPGGMTTTRPVGAFIPIVVNPGSYTVDVIGRLDSGPTITVSDWRAYVRTEAF